MADKKITELPFIDTLSGSLVNNNSPLQNTVIPLVLRGTTNQINIENFSKFVTAYSATTASNHFKADQFITGSLTVTGKLTAQEFHTEITSASIVFESGSTIFGNSGDDTHTFTGSLLLNGVAIGTGQLNSQTASQDLVNTGISSVTGSINTTTSSFDSVFLQISSTTGSINTTTSSFDSVFQRISSTTGSINTTTSSFNSVFLGISSVTGAMNTQSSSQDLVNRQLSLVTGSIHFVTGALNAFTGSVIGQTNTISTFTSSVNFATQSLNTQTGSQNSLNTSLGLITSSIYSEITSFNSVFQRISSTTGSINVQSSSQDLVNLGISTATGSLIGITNGLMAFTAALDSTYATDAQLYQLYQATASIHSTTASLNIQTGSQDLVNRGISSVTGSINTTTSSFDLVFRGISSVTGAMNTQSSSQNLVNLGISSVTGSLIGITNGLMAFTAALDTTYATDAQLYQLYQATASIHITTQSLNTQTGSQDLVNLGISTFTGSIRSEVGLIEAYTASLKAATLISSSNQIFVNGAIVSDNTSQKILGTNSNILYLYSGTSGIYINNQANDTTIAKFTNAGELTIGGPGNDQNLVFGGTNSSIYWGVGGPARMYYNTGDIKISSGGATDVLNIKNIGGISVNGGITGSLMATNGVVSGSNQLPQIAGLQEYTASLKGAIEVSGQNVNVLGMITAQQFNVTYVSSSVMYQSGSNKFGDSPDDKHEFTGSVNINGSITASLRATNGVVSSSAQITELTQIAPLQAYTASLKSAFSVSGTTTTHNGIIDTSENLLYSKRTSPANVNSGATTAFTITQKSGEFQSTYMVSIIGLYDSGGSNQNGFYTGFVTFFTDGAIAQANISSIHSNGWSASAAATTGGSFTITFTNSAATTMTNIRITALKINAT